MASYFARSHPLYQRGSADSGVSRRTPSPPSAQGHAQPKRPSTSTAAINGPTTTTTAPTTTTTTTTAQTTTANGTTRSTRDRLIGTWSLLSYTAHVASDPTAKIHPMGTSPRGIVIYSGDGYMSAQLQVPGQAPFASPAPHGGTEAERAEAGGRYLAYAGPYYVDESGETPALFHHMDISSFPNWQDDTQERLVKFEEEEGEEVLVLGPRGGTMLGGEMRVAELRWKRMRENRAGVPPRAA